MPPELVADVGADTEPPPLAVQFTVTPATGLPCESVTLTESGFASVVPTKPDWLSPALMARVVGTSEVPVALNTTGSRPENTALSVLLPAASPRVHWVAAKP